MHVDTYLVFISLQPAASHRSDTGITTPILGSNNDSEADFIDRQRVQSWNLGSLGNMIKNDVRAYKLLLAKTVLATTANKQSNL